MGVLCVLICLLFCACAGKNGRRAQEEPPWPAKQEETPVLLWWTVGEEPADHQAGMEAINAYLEEKLQIRLDIRYISWAEWTKKTREIIYQKEYFDLMFVDVTDFNLFASMGALADITDLIYTWAPGLWEVMPELVWSGAKQGGRIYAVPSYKDSAMTQYWVFDQTYLDRYQVSVEELQTWEDLDWYFRLLKEGEGEDFYPVLCGRGDNLNIFNEYDSFTTGLTVIGVRMDDAERKVVCLLEEPEILEQLGYLRRWYLDGIINPDAGEVETLGAPRSFFKGIGWPGAEYVWQQKEGVEKLVTKPVYGPVYSRDSIQGSMNAISADSRYKKEALQLLELVNTDRKLRDMLAYGVEGTNFVYTESGEVRSLNRGWNVSFFTQGSFFTLSPAEGSSWEGLRENNEKASRSVLLDFEMDVRDLETELNACKEIWNEYAIDLTLGILDPETAVPACLEQLRANGLDTIISEAQKQIDAYYG